MSRWNNELLGRLLRSLFSFRLSWLHTGIQLFLIVLTSWCSCFAVFMRELVIIMVLSGILWFITQESFLVSRVSSLMTSVVSCIVMIIFMIIVMPWSLHIVIVSTIFLPMAALSFTTVMSTVFIIIFLWMALMFI